MTSRKSTRAPQKRSNNLGANSRARLAQQSSPTRRVSANRSGRPIRTRRHRALVLGTLVALGVLVGVLVAMVGTGSDGSSPSSDLASTPISGPPGPEGVPLEVGPLLAPLVGAANGEAVDGIQCNASEQVVYHVHTHLSVYVNGVLRPLPAGVGIVSPVAQQTAEGPFYGATRCYYWLHVHAQDGVIHIESPTQRAYTLGQFFDIWRQPLSRTEIGSAHGAMKIYVNGRLYAGDPRNIKLGSHEDVQIDVGSPVVAPQKVNWALTEL